MIAALRLVGVVLVACVATAGDGLAERNTTRGTAAVIVEWNLMVNEIAFAEDQFLTFKGARAYSMTHIAQHDALNAVYPAFEQFAYNDLRTRAHPIAAAAQAAREVLVAEYPARRTDVDALLAEHLSDVPNGHTKAAGIELGRRAAATILAARLGDGYDVQGEYSFKEGPGEYQTTPPFAGFVLQPGFRFARPFALASADVFRPKGPPALDSRRYAAAFGEVRETGRVDSSTRTADQTAYAVWWMEFVEGSINRLARRLVDSDSSAWDAARLFAQLNMGIFDSYLAVWDSKFEFNHWRPYTAIRAAAVDGNPRTAADPTWEPLRTTPPFPEHVSAHSAVCGSSFEILSMVFGRHTPFTMDTTTAPPNMPTRTFRSFTAAADECADSRVRLGFHFRYATDAGKELGRRVARYLLRHHLRPRNR
jgi:hypothetical protein